MTTATELRSYLETLAEDPTSKNPKTWKRAAHPAVYADYVAFVQSGRYPYLDAVVTEIITKHSLSDDLSQRFDHQAVHDRDDKLAIALHTEVYIASGQHRVDQMTQRERELIEEGFAPITELTPHKDMKVMLEDAKSYRLLQLPDESDWLLLLPRKSQGLSLNELVRQHHNYLLAKEERQTRMSSPAVRMFKMLDKRTELLPY